MVATTTSDEPLAIEGRKLARATKTTIEIPALELADGTWVKFSVVVLRGKEPGPVFYLGAGVHGDEVGSIAILAEVLQRLSPADIRGTVILVPVQNPLAFQGQHRLPLGLVLKSPTDQSPNDVFMSYPGDPDGNSTQVMAHILYSQLMRKADFLVDIHTPTVGGRYVSFAFLPPPTMPAAYEARGIARAFGVEAILSTSHGVYVHEAAAHVIAARNGVPSFGVEMGEGGRVEPDIVGKGVDGVLNALCHVGVLSGKVEERPEPFAMKEFVQVRARRGGLLRPAVRLGEHVLAGQPIATVTSARGELLEDITSPVAGLFVRATTFPSVCTGERVGQIGVPE
jgi:predicted deacylase